MDEMNTNFKFSKQIAAPLIHLKKVYRSVFSESLVPLATGVNYVVTVIRVALGCEPDFLFGSVTPEKNWNPLSPRSMMPLDSKLQGSGFLSNRVIAS
jgi:hypothetical protein